MSNQQQKIVSPEKIEKISKLRQDIYLILDSINDFLVDRPECIPELTLAKRELQSARHWLGECLSYYDTGYRVTDNPHDSGSESKSE